MVKVCKEEFKDNEGFYLDGFLKQHLDSMVYNVKKRDFDFVIAVAGSGRVRVGKSVLALQIAYYMAHRLGTPFDLSNVVFSKEELLNVTIARDPMPHNHVFVYDECREAMNSRVASSHIGAGMLSFLSECGQLNNILIVVLPDFFELNKKIAVNRTECLINVYLTPHFIKGDDGEKISTLDRGRFKYFTFEEKKRLFLLGKKNFDDYQAIQPKFPPGTFTNFYVVDEAGYRKKKEDSIRRFLDKEKQGAIATPRERLWKERFCAVAKQLLNYERRREVGKVVGMTENTFNHVLADLEKDVPRPDNTILLLERKRAKELLAEAPENMELPPTSGENEGNDAGGTILSLSRKGDLDDDTQGLT